jgi:D-lactate dehydrogenase
MTSRAPKISIYSLWPELVDYTKKKLRSLPSSLHTAPLSDALLDTSTEILVVFIESPVTKETIAKLPKLKHIITMSTGFDHIDLKTAKKRGIAVSNIPSYGENTVAEHAFALILGLTRKLFDSVKRVKEGVYDFHGLRGTDLKGKTLGIIGTGRIGAHVARMARGFDMNIIAYDVHPDKNLARNLGLVYAPVTTVLKKADILTLHTPLLKSTEHLINKKNLRLMKPGSFLVNTARGGLVDGEALLEALNSGHLAGAGLDVLEDENLLQHYEEVMSGKDAGKKAKVSLVNNLLIDHPKTIITPHNAFNSTEALQRIIDGTITTINASLEGEILHPVV